MIRVVQADTDELSDTRNTGPNPALAIQLGQAREICLLQSRQDGIGQGHTVPIINQTTYIPNVTVRVHNTRLFATFRTNPQKFHVISS